MKRIFGYALIVIAFLGGFMYWHPGMILALALVSTLFFASHRRELMKGSAHTLERNPFIEGMFLFLLQCLIMFFVYNLGYFAAEFASR